MTRPVLSVVVAVYNATAYLELILLALRRQSLRGFEVIIADDGSGPEIGGLIDRFRPTAGYPILHIWQEDAGFRKNAVLNKAIGAAETDYLVFIDGDCVPHRDFLLDHQENRTPGSILSGRRVNLSRQRTKQVTPDSIASGAFERLSPGLIWDGLLARSANLEDAVRIRSAFIRKLLHRDRARILGCNFSVEKALLEAVNGFDEEYQAPGLGEDTDVAFRLELNGAKLRTLRYLAVLFHLYHPRTEVGEANRTIFQRTVSSRRIECRQGLKRKEAV